MEKDNILDFVKQIAKLKGYSVNPIEVKTESYAMDDKEYDNKSITELKEILTQVENRQDKILMRNVKFKNSLLKFLSETPATELTRPVYDSNSFIEHALIIRDKELSSIKRIIEFIKSKIKNKTGVELINAFEAKNTNFRKYITNLEVKQGPTGQRLTVDISEPAIEPVIEEEPIEDSLNNVEDEEVIPTISAKKQSKPKGWGKSK